MRVVAGIYKGRKLLGPKTDDVRPTLDNVKQAIFTKLQFFVQNKRVLDLFSGSGALGIEAISRGASEVIFVDNHYDSIELLKKNLNYLNIKAKVLRLDYLKALKMQTGKFDLILLDPPYHSNYYDLAISEIEKLNLLSSEGIIVCESEKDLKINTSNFKILDEKIYGRVKITYLTY